MLRLTSSIYLLAGVTTAKKIVLLLLGLILLLNLHFNFHLKFPAFKYQAKLI